MKETIRKLNILLTKSQKGKMCIVFLLMLLSGIMETTVIASIYTFISTLTNYDEMKNSKLFGAILNHFGTNQINIVLIKMSFVLAGLCLIKAVVSFIANYANFKFANSFFYQISKLIYEKYVYSDYGKIVQTNSANIIRCITQDTLQVYELIKNLMLMLLEIFTVSCVLLYLFSNSPVIMILFSIPVGVMFVILRLAISKPLVGYSARRLSGISEFIRFMNQTSSGIKMIKINHLEKEFEEEYLFSIGEVKNATIRTDTFGYLPKMLIENIGMIIIFCVIGIVGIAGNDFGSILPILATLAMAVYKIFPGCSRVASYYASIVRCSVSLDNILSIEEGQYGEGESEKIEFEIVKPKNGVEIELKNVYFKFSDDKDYLLSNINLKIEKNQSIAFVGETGSGKTTLADIILGLRKPSSGSIYVEKRNIYENTKWWGNMVGYVPQNIILMDDSIKNNILFKGKYDEHRLIKVLKEAQLWDFINSLPEKWDTKVGELGVRLSGGQKQRIGIARALYKSPSFLVLDEATSALDVDTESAIVDTIEKLKGQMTILIIAHRLSTIENCDYVYKIENKELVLKKG